MKKWIAVLILCIQCLLVSSCSLSNPSVVTSAESSYVFSTGSLESSQNSSSVKNEEDQPLYTDVIVDQEYTGTYEPEEWSLQVEAPEDVYEPFSGPVTLREVDESEIINPIIVSGKFPMPLITNDGKIQELMSTVNENVPFTVLFNADHHAYTGMYNNSPAPCCAKRIWGWDNSNLSYWTDALYHTFRYMHDDQH